MLGYKGTRLNELSDAEALDSLLKIDVGVILGNPPGD